MMKKVFRLAVCVCGLILLASPAFAQALPWEGKGYVNINFGYQIASTDPVTSTQTFTIYDETGKITTTQDINRQQPLLDIGGGIRLFGNFGIGFAYTYLTSDGDAAVEAEVPSPLVYDQPRKASTTATGLEHVEQGYHFQLIWMLPINDRFDAMLSAGPTMYSLKQGTVLTPTVTEVGPPYTAVNMTATVANTTATRLGFNVGADLTYRFSNAVGVGATVRYAAAKFDLEPEGGGALTVNAGGFQIGGGLRFRF